MLLILLRLQHTIDRILDVRADIHSHEEGIVARGIHPIGKKNIDQVRLGIDPDAGTSKARMAEC